MVKKAISKSKVALQSAEISSSNSVVGETSQSMHLVVEKASFALHILAQIGNSTKSCSIKSAVLYMRSFTPNED